MPVLEFVGYLGSVLVAVSLMMSNIVRLRWINLFGAAVFSTYGILIGAFPVFLLNGFITLVDIYYLIQLKKQRESFELLKISVPNSSFLRRFLQFHKESISGFFPEFDLHKLIDPQGIFILRNMLPVGLFIYEEKAPYIRIHLDYVIPEYRDLKNARFLFRRTGEFIKDDYFDGFIVRSTVKAHRRYLEKLGFREMRIDGTEWYFRRL